MRPRPSRPGGSFPALAPLPPPKDERPAWMRENDEARERFGYTSRRCCPRCGPVEKHGFRVVPVRPVCGVCFVCAEHHPPGNCLPPKAPEVRP